MSTEPTPLALTEDGKRAVLQSIVATDRSFGLPFDGIRVSALAGIATVSLVSKGHIVAQFSDRFAIGDILSVDGLSGTLPITISDV